MKPQPDRAANAAPGHYLAVELREALDDPRRGEWGGYPWEHLGDAERDVLALLAYIESLEANRREEVPHA